MSDEVKKVSGLSPLMNEVHTAALARGCSWAGDAVAGPGGDPGSGGVARVEGGSVTGGEGEDVQDVAQGVQDVAQDTKDVGRGGGVQLAALGLRLMMEAIDISDNEVGDLDRDKLRCSVRMEAGKALAAAALAVPRAAHAAPNVQVNVLSSAASAVEARRAARLAQDSLPES